MKNPEKFPLLSGNLALDLVNTEVVRLGKRHDLLLSEANIWNWLETMQEHIPFWNTQQIELKESLTRIAEKLIAIRSFLRENFEEIADTQLIKQEFISTLESYIEKAPITFKLQDETLNPFPIGKTEDTILALISLNALELIADQKLQFLKHCSNPDCVLLFIDKGNRRKWCSMKICGNRHKVAKFQNKK